LASTATDRDSERSSFASGFRICSLFFILHCFIFC
jgi:hypothetical protein